MIIDPNDLDFKKGGGLIAAVVQDDRTGRVLMLGYMNREALEQTLRDGVVTFYSRTRERLWTKGETSGNRLVVRGIVPDCDGDAVLVRALPTGPVCHTGRANCFDEGSAKGFLYELEETIAGRAQNPPENSYTARLFEGGVDAIAQKVGEEAIELVIEAKNRDDDRFLNESADLLYHLLVLLRLRGYGLTDVEKILHERARGETASDVDCDGLR